MERSLRIESTCRIKAVIKSIEANASFQGLLISLRPQTMTGGDLLCRFSGEIPPSYWNEAKLVRVGYFALNNDASLHPKDVADSNQQPPPMCGSIASASFYFPLFSCCLGPPLPTPATSTFYYFVQHIDPYI